MKTIIHIRGDIQKALDEIERPVDGAEVRIYPTATLVHRPPVIERCLVFESYDGVEIGD